MTWNDLVSNVREKIQRGLARTGRQESMLPAAQGTRLEPLGDARFLTPAIDVYESDKELLVVADVPGGSREGAQVAWDERSELTFVVKPQGLPKGTVRGTEYRPNEWYRALELPDYADGAKATSTIKDGVLTIHIPKREATSKRIPVMAG